MELILFKHENNKYVPIVVTQILMILIRAWMKVLYLMCRRTRILDYPTFPSIMIKGIIPDIQFEKQQM